MVDSGNRVPSQEWPGQESYAQLELSANTTYFFTELVWGLAEATMGGVLKSRPTQPMAPTKRSQKVLACLTEHRGQ